MRVEETKIPGVLVLEPKVFGDERGFFFESFNQRRWKEATGLDTVFVQENHSRSVKNVLRGLHFQRRQPQAKLVSCTRGRIFDVAVDIRKDSPTFRQWFGCELNEDNHFQLFIPRGFAHGFFVLSDIAEIFYKCDDFYLGTDDCGIAWNDPDIAVQWPLTEPPILSAKDQVRPLLRDLTDLPTL